MIRHLEIYTDASHCHVTGISTYAFKVECERFTLNGRGLIGKRHEVRGSTDAEVMAIRYAMNAYLYKTKDFSPRVRKISIYSDCIPAFEQIEYGKSKIAKSTLYVKGLIWKNSYRPEISYEFVRAHIGRETKPQWENYWLDLTARSELRKHVQKLKKS